MKVLYRLLLLCLLSLCSRAQLPFFLHRFRPRQHISLLSSASTAYPSFFPSSSFLSASPFFSDHPSFGSASSFAPSLADFGTSAGHFEGLGGGFEQAELVDDYQGFSNAGFAKDLNFAGSHPLRSHSYGGGGGEQLFFLQRE